MLILDLGQTINPMSNRMTQKDKEDLKKLIGENKLSEAIKLLGSFNLEEEQGNELVLLQSRYSSFQEEKRKDILSHENAKIAQNKIKDGLISLIDKIEIEEVETPDGRPKKKNKWKDRIGSDVWKSIISAECELVKEANFKKESTKKPRLYLVEVKEEENSRCAFAFNQLYNDYDNISYLVFQAGRLFLVGAPEDVYHPARRIIVDSCKKGKAPFFWGCNHLHLVLLSWQDGHIKGLRKIPKLLGLLESDKKDTNTKFENLTIWTSSWIWEEILLQLSNESIADDLRSLKRLTVEQAESGIKSGAIKRSVITCDEELDMQLALGVRLQLNYTFSYNPSLRVHFICNNQELILDPFADYTKADLAKVRGELYEIYAVNSPQNVKLSLRYNRLERYLKKKLETQNANGASDLKLTRIIDYPIRETDKWWQLNKGTAYAPIDMNMMGKKKASIEFESGKMPGSCEKNGCTNPKYKWCPNDVMIAIGCGRLARKQQRELLDPGRMIAIPSKDFQSEDEGKIILSILEMRLTEINHWAETHLKAAKSKSKLHVLLLTSPDTYPIVYEHKRDFEQRYENVNRYIEITILEHQLVPQVEMRKNGILYPTAMKDGGWTLDSIGHLDQMRLYKLFWDRLEKNKHKPKLCFAFSYNNLGNFFRYPPKDDLTKKNIIGFIKKSGVFADEMFTMEIDDDDERWNQMSYVINEKKNWEAVKVYKSGYKGAMEKLDIGDTYTFSAHTWYIKLEEGLNLWKDLDSSEMKYILKPEDSNPDSFYPRIDMDQLSHIKNLPVVQILKPEEREPEETTSDKGIYKYERFMVVRTEDHLINERFRSAFKDQLKNNPFRGTYPQLFDGEKVPNIVLAEISPAIHSTVWGWKTISMMKGLHKKQIIGETWEVSTHSAGPSFIQFGNMRRASLSSLPEASFNYMIKYLDCHKSLSIQAHPDENTAMYLHGLRKKGFKGINIRDKSGKEESFYVLHTAARKKFHLYLGFDREKLRPIAKVLRPCLHEYANREWNEEVYNGLLDILRSELDRLVEDIAGELFKAKKLFKDGDEKDDFIKSFEHLWRWDDEKKLTIKGAFRYHVEKKSTLKHDNSKYTYPLRLLGKEYIFAGIGIIAVIKGVADYVYNLPKTSYSVDKVKEIKKEAKALFSDEESLLLKYFHKQSVEAGDWVRIPAGTVHAWQGGGNFLIEVSHKSDNTFRILDYGRELDRSKRREMHYFEAMFALGLESIQGTTQQSKQSDDKQDKRLTERLRFPATFARCEPSREIKRVCHELIDYSLIRSGEYYRIPFAGSSTKDDNKKDIDDDIPIDDKDSQMKRSGISNPDNPAKDYDNKNIDDDDGIRVKNSQKTWSVILNPDNPIRLRAKSNEPYSNELYIERCRATLVRKENTFTISGYEPDDMILHFYPRRNFAPNLLCISLGATKVEIAVRKQGKLPATTAWQKIQNPYDDKIQEIKLLEHVLGEIAKYYNKAQDENPNGQSKSEEKTDKPKLDIAISWPGYIDGNSYYSTLFGKIEKTDLVEILSKKFELFEKTDDKRLIVMNDAQVNAFGEHWHPLGGLLGSEPGMVLNVGSGVCVGLFSWDLEEGFRKGQKSKSDFNAICAVGRWIYVDPTTKPKRFSVKSRDEKSIDKLRSWVFTKKAPLFDDERIRVSAWLSSWGLALRFLSQIENEDHLIYFLNESDWAKDDEALRQKLIDVLKYENYKDLFERGSKLFKGNSYVFPPHRLLHQINMACKEEASASTKDGSKKNPDLLYRLAHEFVREVAEEIAQIIEFICGHESIFFDKRGIITKCAKRIVLTGAVGEFLGEATTSPDNSADDLFIHVIKEHLNKYFNDDDDKPDVKRSEINIAPEREAEGFAYYYNIMNLLKEKEDTNEGTHS